MLLLCVQLDSVRLSYHKACQKEQTTIDKEKQANESETTPEKQQKLTAAREKAAEEKEKVRRDAHTLHHITSSQCVLTRG